MITKFKQLDWWIAGPYLILSVIGIVMVFSASSNMASGSAMVYLLKQTAFVGVGIAAIVFLLSLNMQALRRMIATPTVVYLLGGVLLVTEFLPAVNGAHGWIPLPGFSLQPVEFFKVFLIIYIADFMSKHPWQIGRGLTQQSLFQPSRNHAFWPILGSFGLIFIYPDLGNLFITGVIVLVLLLLSGMRRWWAFIVSAGALILGFLLPKVLALLHLNGASHYQLGRLTAFVNPWENADAGHQLIIAYYAIAHGGLFGVGLGNSILKQGYLPEPNTDFIMAVMVEELGAVLTTVVLLLEFLLIWRIMLLGIRQSQQFYRLLLFGLATFLFVQILVNFGGVLGILPITGVTFPFISYGGSSFLVLSIAVGLALNISNRRKKVGGG
ncbi:MAG TPA: FtsW/RodA/SpoVE family cell cycle protein [Lactobacillaceae bacterium]|jgi:cell division protein FtsW